MTTFSSRTSGDSLPGNGLKKKTFDNLYLFSLRGALKQKNEHVGSKGWS